MKSRTSRRIKLLFPWNELYWGVVINSHQPKGAMLLGQGWLYAGQEDRPRPVEMPGLAPQPILFKAREDAAAWCRGIMNNYALGGSDICKRWRFRPVRVRSTTRIVYGRQKVRKNQR